MKILTIKQLTKEYQVAIFPEQEMFTVPAFVTKMMQDYYESMADVYFKYLLGEPIEFGDIREIMQNIKQDMNKRTNWNDSSLELSLDIMEHIANEIANINIIKQQQALKK